MISFLRVCSDIDLCGDTLNVVFVEKNVAFKVFVIESPQSECH